MVLRDHSACSHQDLVYVAGGYVSQRMNGEKELHISGRLFAYDSKADIWLSKASMKKPRAGAVFESLDAKLYILGGGVLGEAPHSATPTVEVSGGSRISQRRGR